MDLGFLTPDLSASALQALAEVVVIDLVLAADNAIVVGIAAAGVPAERRNVVIFWGLAAAVVMRLGFALVTTQLLQVIGLMLAGGILLLWVAWRLFRELVTPDIETTGAEIAAEGFEESLLGTSGGGAAAAAAPAKSMRTAITQIVLADVSMSLDNVLAVAGAAMEHPWVLTIGLVLSVALMGAAATLIARVLNRHRWIGFVGLAVIAVVALRMIVEGGEQVLVSTGAL